MTRGGWWLCPFPIRSVGTKRSPVFANRALAVVVPSSEPVVARSPCFERSELASDGRATKKVTTVPLLESVGASGPSPFCEQSPAILVFDNVLILVLTPARSVCFLAHVTGKVYHAIAWRVKNPQQNLATRVDSGGDVPHSWKKAPDGSRTGA